MKIGLKKKIITLIPIACLSLGGMIASAKGVNTENNARQVVQVTSAQQSRAASSLRIKGDGNKLGYLKSSTGSVVYFPSKTSETYGPAYCVQKDATTPPSSWTTYSLSGEQSKKVLYAMEYNTGLGTSAEYYVKAMGVHYAYGEYPKVMTQSGVTETVAGVKSKAQGLAKILDSGSYKTTQDVTTSLNTSTLTFTKNGNYYDSNWITVKVNQPSGLDFGAQLVNTVVNISGAPSGTQVINQAGYVATNNNIGTYTMYHLRIPASSLSGTKSIRTSVTSEFTVGAAYLYRNGGYQPMVVRGTKNIKIASSGSASGSVTGTSAPSTPSTPPSTPPPSSPGKGGLRVVAKDTNDDLVAGAGYQVMSNGVSITSVRTTNSNGEIIFTDIPAGTYTLVNTSYPSTHLSSGTATVIVSAGVTNRKTMIHPIATGNLRVVKKDQDGNLLQGAVFRVEKNGRVVAGPSTTNSNGEIIFRGIPVGSGTLVEVSAPSGYKINGSGRKDIWIDYNTTNRSTVINERQTGTIRVMKEDSADSRRLSGAQFTLYNSSGSTVAVGTTDLSGTVTFSEIPLGTYRVKETKAPTGYFLNNTSYTLTLSSSGQVVSKTVYNDRKRDFSMPGYNVKDNSGKIVGTLEKNKSYDFNVKIESELVDLILPSGSTLTSPTIDKFKYAIAVNDGTINQDTASITTSNIKGTIITSGTRTNIPIRDLSEIWQNISFKIPDNDTYGEIVFVVEMESSKDANSSNNRLVVKLPIVNPRKDEVTITNTEVYPSQSGAALVGNDVNVKIDLSTNSLKTYDVTTKIKVTGPSGYGTKTFTKPAYGVSLEEPGKVYYKFKPTVAGRYTITSEASITGSSDTGQTKTITVVHPSEPKTYFPTGSKTSSSYDANSSIVTYVKVQKKDKDKIETWKHDSGCQEDEKGVKLCPGHKEWVWGEWYNAFVPRKNTSMSGIKENYNITEIKFRSKLTEDNAKKHPMYISADGYVNMLNPSAAKYAQVKAGYGFEMEMKSEYSNNLPTVFNRAYANNSAPSNTRWSEYKMIGSSSSKIPFIYADIYGDSKSVSVDTQVASYSGVVSVAVPSLSDLIIESPNQIYVKLPDPSGEYYMVNEGYGATYSNKKVVDGLAMTHSSGVKLTSEKYSETKQFAFKKNASNSIEKRGYYVSKEVSDGERTLSVYNRYAGYGLNNSTRLKDRKDVTVKIYGGRYDDVKDSE